MDKNAIKKYAVWARRELISRVSQKALQYGISEKETVPASAASVNGVVLSAEEIKQRKALIEQINAKGYEQVMEEVAYTWFNRFIALRFMEVNGYLPSHIRVFTDENNAFRPQIITEAINLELDGLDMDKVYAWKDANDNDSLFKYLIITQCNALSPILPRMFQRIADYTELLFPDNLLREGSAIQQMIELIPEDDWKDAVQIIGWLYQYYNSEKKDEVFAALKKNVKITKENIPAATQLFTPDWIVRYMVENSLGRLWIEGHPNDSLKTQWKYYLEEAEQEPDVQAQLVAIRKEYAAMAPEQIKCIDPCAGSGHILAYMFDVLVQIYEDYGYSAREAVRNIIVNNLYGLDIDERAAQFAYFTVMMKARQYDRRFFARKGENGEPDVPQPQVYTVLESGHLDTFALEYFVNNDGDLEQSMASIIHDMQNAKERGSLIRVSPVNFGALYERFEEVRNDINMSRDAVLDELLPLVQVAHILAQKYDAFITNPPYLSSGNMDAHVSDFVSTNYPDSKSDLCTCFIEKSFEMLRPNGFSSMITMESWMSLSSFKNMRTNLLENKTIISMVHMPYLGKGGTSLGINFGTAATVIRNKAVAEYNAVFDRVIYLDCDDEGVPHSFPVVNEYYNITKVSNFFAIPGSPLSSYYASKEVFNSFINGQFISDIATPASGTSTGDNDTFLRLWHEVPFANINFNAQNGEVADGRWFPCNKGGAYRRWAGGAEYVMDWENDGARIRNCPKAFLRNVGSLFLPGLTWSKLGSGAFSIRQFGTGFICESIGCCLFNKSEDLRLILALLNSKVGAKLLSIINPSMGRQPGYIGAVPFLMPNSSRSQICELTDECVEITTNDWNTFETAWNFVAHPLTLAVTNKEKVSYKLSAIYEEWKILCERQFAQLKENEEILNKLFIDIYNLGAELTPDVEPESISTRRADLKQDIKSLISYAVGCMFGRYSLDVPGLAYAGGEWDDSKYTSFKADKDSIIPICDDEYFADDIVGRFIRFIEVVFGKETLQENLRFIADALGGSGQPKDVIRNYFLNDFYADHLKVYQKRPIYWLFDSGKNNGFKALVYMHRYQPDTIARMRTDYVHEQQAR